MLFEMMSKIDKTFRYQINESESNILPIVFIKRGKIKVGMDKVMGEREYVKPNISIENSIIDSKSIDSKNFTYRWRVTFIDTDNNELKYSDYIRMVGNGNYVANISYNSKQKSSFNKLKLRDISVDIITFNKGDEKNPVDVTNINTYQFNNHDDSGYIKLDDNVSRVYKNNVSKTDDDASYNRGDKKVFRRGGKDLNKIDDNYFNDWEKKFIQVGKYKGKSYGEIMNTDKQYFGWYLQNVTYYEMSSETKYDIPTKFNYNLYEYLKSKGLF
jgi:hypothetical protein